MATLRRQLTARHLSMIALGGSLGTGIFLTSGSAIYQAGPGGAMLAYLLMGFMVYLIMGSLGEMAAFRPVSGSFCEYASDYVSKPFGFAMGYNYWFNWAITIAVELIAASIVMQYWFPTLSPMLWCGLFFTAIIGLNLLSVKHYGEAEYWLSLMKVIAILAFIVIGVLVMLGINTAHHSYGLHNWTLGDAPLHGGLSSLFAVFLLSGFSFQGTELVGIAAGESKNPERTIPQAIRKVFWRILIFYILTMAIMSCIIPYTDSHLLNANNSVAMSPFTLILQQCGLHGVASIMNAVILIALLSACNSDCYSATRVLWHLAEKGSAPKALARTNRYGVPVTALLITAAFGLLSLLCNHLGSGMVFLWLVNVSSLSGFIAWFGIALSHYKFRQAFIAAGGELSALPYRARFYPWGPIIALVMCSVIIAGQGYLLLLQPHASWLTWLSTYIGLPVVIGLWWANKMYRQQQQRFSCAA